ncbi:hypothetical protein FIV00_11940 [Labrenzia sp. THAF82]|nr:hypothetical protein FIV00_11940 [Labrenzia sp. THAF82]
MEMNKEKPVKELMAQLPLTIIRILTAQDAQHRQTMAGELVRKGKRQIPWTTAAEILSMTGQ